MLRGRDGSYPIAVTRSLPETLERLLELIGEAHVAVITDRAVGASCTARRCCAASAMPAARARGRGDPRRRAPQDLPQAFELLDWLTGPPAPS